MDAIQPPSPDHSWGPSASQGAPVADPRQQPTADYGTLGGGSISPRSAGALRFGPVIAVAIGVLAALLVGGITRAHASWSRFNTLFSLRTNVPLADEDRRSARQLDGLKPQKQAETLLELAVSQRQGANDQIALRVDRWQGKLKWNSQMATLTTAALNSRDMRVRESGIEVELAAYGLAKNSASLEYLLNTAESPDHAQKIWALWALGLMGNRGVETDRIIQVLTEHLKDSDEESRRWAVEGLALVGNAQTINPLLQSMHDDPSPMVRERAACNLAESGMFTHALRLSAVPQLLIYTDDPSLDTRTHGWAFQALNDITHQHLPNDSAAWRAWYESTRGD